jgi:polar amino acid transport system substrate-binding protein
MKHPNTRTGRLAAGVVVAMAVSMTTACGGATPSATTQAHQASFDRALHDKLPESILDRGVIRVGTDASYAPMSSFAPDGRTIVGMEPDLGQQIGHILGVRIAFVDTDFTKLLPYVVSGHLDIAMSAMTDTPARAKTVDFVNYFSAGTSIVVRHGNPTAVTDIKDLCGKIVAVEKGTTQVDLLARAQTNCVEKGITVKTFETNSDALLQLRTGRAAAVLNDLPPAVFLVNDPRTRSQYQLASTTQYEPGLYGIVVAKGQPGIRDAIQGACEELLRTGGYATVLDRWRVRSGAIERITVNSDR